jgi:DNA adenine methylase
MTVPRPVLRWHGGKWLLAPWIIEHFPTHQVYVEPFGGAASVLMRKERSYAEIYNDLDTEAVCLFRVLQDASQAEELHRRLLLTPYARMELLGAYDEPRDDIDRARHLIIRSFMGFGSDAHNPSNRQAFRANSNKSGSTPAHDWVTYADALPAAVKRFRGVVVENRDASVVMAQHDTPATLHYVDPPYVHSTRTSGKRYSHELTEGAHSALLETLRGLAGMVVLSGYPHPLYDAALSDWRRVEKAALADGAKPRTEVLWINPHCAARLDAERAQLSLLDEAS